MTDAITAPVIVNTTEDVVCFQKIVLTLLGENIL